MDLKGLDQTAQGTELFRLDDKKPAEAVFGEHSVKVPDQKEEQHWFLQILRNVRDALSNAFPDLEADWDSADSSPVSLRRQ